MNRMARNGAVQARQWAAWGAAAVLTAGLLAGCAESSQEHKVKPAGNAQPAGTEAQAPDSVARPAVPAPSSVDQSVTISPPTAQPEAEAAPTAPAEPTQPPAAATTVARAEPQSEPATPNPAPNRRTPDAPAPANAGEPALDGDIAAIAANPDSPLTDKQREQLRALIRARAEAQLKERAAARAREGSRAAQPPPPAGPAAPAVDAPQPPARTPQAAEAPATEGTPTIEVTPTVFDFGTVWRDAPAQQEFTIRNVGDAPLTVTARSSCGCTVPTQPKSPVAPGESTTFEVSYRTSITGKANKVVTLATNDPTNRAVRIPVRGEVKSLFAGKPQDRIVFAATNENLEATETLRLENQYDQPVNLTLVEQNYAPFDVRLNEIVPGQIYELVARTNPPLRKGVNATNVRLVTDLASSPEMTVSVMANVQPRVRVVPDRLFVYSNSNRPVTRTLYVQYFTEQPVEITGVEVSHDSLSAELLEMPPAQPGEAVARYRVQVTTPPYDEVPDGAKVVIFTNDTEFGRIEVPVEQRKLPSRGIIRPEVGGAPAPSPSDTRTAADPAQRDPATR